MHIDILAVVPVGRQIVEQSLVVRDPLASGYNGVAG
jgi:hypothetical protein